MLNIHSHSRGENTICNLLAQEIDQIDAFQNQWFSIGVHPWYLADWQQQLTVIAHHIGKKNVLAIGECGLDALVETPIDKQIEIFDMQVQLAEQHHKPVIIHCVKAHNELISWKKKCKMTVPLIVHGFNNNTQIAQQLLKNGFYISLGAALLNVDSNASKIIVNIALERLFLENDDKEIPIADIYKVAAQRLNCSISALQKQIWKNGKHIGMYDV